MPMPLPFDKLEYSRILQASGVPPAQAEAHADALSYALSEPVCLSSDLAILKAEILAQVSEMFVKFKAEILAEVDKKLRPIYWMLAASLLMHAIVLTKLFL
ncbi:hypothetical protein [Pseudoduganella violacea]|uniref:DUF1640 domain-containing protein n=1 Tax=Pseudoduganella violacea TaxID=1715466 RepID=A0A7W5FSQ5_9BURK|nr:hypothetical protein [Pseudoduganella violacea]MBB3117443.1 hypothetical protein [Pseudoduganella violacea]